MKKLTDIIAKLLLCSVCVLLMMCADNDNGVGNETDKDTTTQDSAKDTTVDSTDTTTKDTTIAPKDSAKQDTTIVDTTTNDAVAVKDTIYSLYPAPETIISGNQMFWYEGGFSVKPYRSGYTRLLAKSYLYFTEKTEKDRKVEIIMSLDSCLIDTFFVVSGVVKANDSLLLTEKVVYKKTNEEMVSTRTHIVNPIRKDFQKYFVASDSTTTAVVGKDDTWFNLDDNIQNNLRKDSTVTDTLMYGYIDNYYFYYTHKELPTIFCYNISRGSAKKMYYCLKTEGDYKISTRQYHFIEGYYRGGTLLWD